MEAANLLKTGLRICYSTTFAVFYLSKQSLACPDSRVGDIDPQPSIAEMSKKL